ncbi:class I SAM-dependent methyltransferase [Actinocatenispora sera]|uniref:class I SAM-dependent methyltransferase n=1 Tax=Actinocatenispora sera TaxID=390989 RepID=UPI0033C140AB
MAQRERYGVDAPGVVAAMLALGAVFAAAAWPVAAGLSSLVGTTVGVLAAVVLGCYALSFWVATGWMVIGSLWGKRRAWNRLLDAAGLCGGERVLEVGPGRGQVLTVAARRLTTGRAVGVDVWRAKDQAGNGPQALVDNLTAAGVAGRVDVVTGDMRRLPFPSGSFDLALACLAVHNLPAADQAVALTEILRVLAPGGRLILLDFRRTDHFAAVLRESGARDVVRGRRRWFNYPPVRVVTAAKGPDGTSAENLDGRSRPAASSPGIDARHAGDRGRSLVE